jgi:hypothetical protein
MPSDMWFVVCIFSDAGISIGTDWLSQGPHWTSYSTQTRAINEYSDRQFHSWTDGLSPISNPSNIAAIRIVRKGKDKIVREEFESHRITGAECSC